MRKIVLILTWTLVVGLFLAMIAELAFADTKIPDDQVFKVPGEGPDITINVPVSAPAPTTTIIQKGSNLLLRGGVSASAGFPGRSYPSLTDGLIGEIGLSDSSWRLQATLRAGSCKKGWWGDLALDSGLAVMRNLNKHVRAGIGADLMYCAAMQTHPQEDAGERVVGGSLLINIDVTRHLVVGASVGLGAATIPTPGNRDTQPTFYGGLNISHLWGGKGSHHQHAAKKPAAVAPDSLVARQN